MRILFINPYYYPNNTGGTERVLKLLADELVCMGNSVAVFTGDGKNKTITDEFIDSVRVYRGVKGTPTVDRPSNGFNYFTNRIVNLYNAGIKKELNAVIDDFKPDVIHTQNLFGMSANVWVIAKKRGIPVVHTTHDYWMLEKKRFLWYRRYSSIVSMATAPSEFTAKHFVECGMFLSDKMCVIPNGMVMNEKQHRVCVAEKLERDSSTPIKFLYAGQLTKDKGVDHLLHAFSNLSDLPIDLYICGKGPLAEMCYEFEKKNSRIHAMGLLSYDQMEKMYHATDVLVAPSVWAEPFGMVAIEALYYGLPVIAGDRGGLGEIIRHVGIGKLVNGNDEEQITNAIIEYSDRKRLKKELKQISDSIFDYTVQNQASRFLQFYNKVLGR